MTKSKRRPIDWERIEAEYRAGQLSIREIGRQHKVNDRAIRLRAADEQWERALAERVRAKVKERLVREDAGLPATPHPTPQSTPRGLARAPADKDESIVEAAAERGAAVVRLERTDISELRETKAILHERLQKALKDHDEIVQTIIEETKDDKRATRRRNMLEAVGLAAVMDIAVSLTGMVAKIHPLERKAFNLDDEKTPDDTDPLERLRKSISGTAFRPNEDDTDDQPQQPSAIRPTE
jgi:hypothetical protein